MKTTVFNLSRVYEQESVLDRPGLEILDFRDLEGANCYCDAQAAARLSEAARDSIGRGSLIHWIDTGDYHYISLFYAALIRRPFSLVLFDHHSDEQASAFGALSCGSWVAELKKTNPYLREVISVGPDDSYVFNKPDSAVYVSIDLDILSKNEFETDWDQGNYSFSSLKSSLEVLKSSGTDILGIDICGGLTREKGASDCILEGNARVRLALQEIVENFFD